MLGARFEAYPNALNLLRLLLASTVVVYHAARFRTHDLSDPVLQLLAELPVDGFFAISGFLICRSWVHRPDAGTFLVARATRLMPGLFGALMVTAFIVAPVVTNPSIHAQLRYVGENLVTLGAAGPYGLRDAVLGVPVETWGWWNQSLWTLSFEAFFYLVVAYLGISGRLRVRVLVAMAAVLWAAGFLPVFVADGISLTYPGLALPRLGLMFACGALLWLLRDRVPIRAWMLAATVAVVCLGSLLPNYRLLAAPALAYLCLHLGLLLGRFRWCVLRHDLSYGVYVYGWPVQALLLSVGVAGPWPEFAALSLAAALPFAAASWFLMERPAMRLRQRLTRSNPAPVGSTPAGGAAVL